MKRPKALAQAGSKKRGLEYWAEKKLEAVEQESVNLKLRLSEEAPHVEPEGRVAFGLLLRAAPFAVMGFLLFLIGNIVLGAKGMIEVRLLVMSLALLLGGGYVYGCVEWESRERQKRNYDLARKQYALEQREKLLQTKREDLALSMVEEYDVGPQKGVALASAYAKRYSDAPGEKELEHLMAARLFD